LEDLPRAITEKQGNFLNPILKEEEIMFNKLIISGCLVLAMVVMVLAASEEKSDEKPDEKTAKITYVDATDGETGNTKLASGEVFKATTANSGMDNLWRLRTGYANPPGSGTIYEAGGTYGETANPEDCPRLVTTISGLPEGTYKVYVYFWSDDSQWRIRADLKGKDEQLPLFYSRPISPQEAAPTSTPAAALAKAEDFEAAPLLSEGNRTLWQAYLGEVKGTTITVFVDDDPAHKTHSSRTWYDGIGYQAVTQ
jgi:hypothetical protein